MMAKSPCFVVIKPNALYSSSQLTELIDKLTAAQKEGYQIVSVSQNERPKYRHRKRKFRRKQ